MAGSTGPAAGANASPDANAVYSLGHNQAESARLSRQADELAADSSALIDRAGLRPGQSAIDLGCGPRGVLELLADRVGPGGRVVGADADPLHAAMAKEFAAARGLSGVDVIATDLLRSMRAQILELGLASEAELDDMDAAVRAHFDDPRTVVLPHLFFLTSGRKPRMG